MLEKLRMALTRYGGLERAAEVTGKQDRLVSHGKPVRGDDMRKFLKDCLLHCELSIWTNGSRNASEVSQ
jgi:hypothetical protein